MLDSYRAPPQVADRGTPSRYGWYRGNQIPGADKTSKGKIQQVSVSERAACWSASVLHVRGGCFRSCGVANIPSNAFPGGR